jgi:hypothetical protein
MQEPGQTGPIRDFRRDSDCKSLHINGSGVRAGFCGGREVEGMDAIRRVKAHVQWKIFSTLGNFGEFKVNETSELR